MLPTRQHVPRRTPKAVKTREIAEFGVLRLCSFFPSRRTNVNNKGGLQPLMISLGSVIFFSIARISFPINPIGLISSHSLGRVESAARNFSACLMVLPSLVGLDPTVVSPAATGDHRDVRNDGESRKDYWTLTPDDLGKEPGETAWLRDPVG